MLVEYKKKLFFGIGLSFLVFITRIFFFTNKSLSGFKDISDIFSIILLIYGLCMYAKGKGRCWAWGLFGILYSFGLIVPFLLKDSFLKDTNRQKIFIFFGYVIMILGTGLLAANSIASGDDIFTVSIASLLILGGIGLKEQFK